ncbi:dephospho-CoA kinase [bacterium]|nr:dephospho-CoA kinase [bacterium]
MNRLLKVGLTGGIAAGKSTVLMLWQQAGAAGIDTDALAHRALEPETPTWAAVVCEFGESILRPDRTIDRRKLGALVFADEQRRQALNAIVHPVIHRWWREGVAAIEQAGAPAVVVVAIPLLYEVGVAAEFDRVVVIGCSEPTQLARLGAKGLTATEARARLAAQWPLADKMERADFVIWNDGSRRILAAQAEEIWSRLKET